ncbi:MAG TPA: FAD-dependent oxidoreductase [Candidatus Thermoplasmatota archaeon]|nr:FAD-dependent oxidoreductase [Candidatus Thermoplasmatota archaeon]
MRQRAVETGVLGVREETPTVRSIRVPRPPALRWVAGQHASVGLATPAGVERRLLSIASSPLRDEMWFASARGSSTFKRAFFALAEGGSVQVAAPEGDFVLDPDAASHVLLTEGIGVTAALGILEYAMDARLPQRFALVYAAADPREFVFADRIDALAAARPGWSVVYTVTEPKEHDLAWPEFGGRVGRIDADLVSTVAPPDGRTTYYASGPRKTVERLRETLLSLDVPEARIRQEVFLGY